MTVSIQYIWLLLSAGHAKRRRLNSRGCIHFVVRLYKAKAIIGWLILELLDHVFSALVIEESLASRKKEIIISLPSASISLISAAVAAQVSLSVPPCLSQGYFTHDRTKTKKPIWRRCVYSSQFFSFHNLLLLFFFVCLLYNVLLHLYSVFASLCLVFFPLYHFQCLFFLPPLWALFCMSLLSVGAWCVNETGPPDWVSASWTKWKLRERSTRLCV